MSNIPTICLNMIVKNESKVITRLLSSVLPIIDSYCICDTGSTDNTKEIISGFFAEHGIPGKIVEEPFRDFGYNRSIALKACDDMDADYILLLDADMVLTGSALKNPESFKRQLTVDAYHMYQGSAVYYYKNIRIVKNKANFSYWGVTHEYVKFPTGAISGGIERDVLFIEDIGDGGAKGNKIERDIALLEKGLIELPDNDRYTFYLANSYRDGGRYEDAIRTYKKRIEIGGWIEEIWYSYYMMGKSYMELNRPNEAITAWLDGYNAHPARIENLYKIMEYYRNNGKNNLVYNVFLIADESRKKFENWSEYLFLERNVYDYKIDYELSIAVFYVNPKLLISDKNEFGANLCMKILNYEHADHAHINNSLSNYKFYVDAIVKKYEKENRLTGQNKSILNGIADSVQIPSDFYRSTPSLCVRENQLIVNVRYVNYKIGPKGEYINKEYITTINVVAIIDIYSSPVWKQTEEYTLSYDTKEDGRYIGLEDVRLFVDSDNKIKYNANRGLKDGNMCVEYGDIDFGLGAQCKNSVFLRMKGQDITRLEKNWVFFLDTLTNMEMCIYGWSPLKIGKINEKGEFCEMKSLNVPGCFREMRGSTNGILVDDEIWFICHRVSYEDRRFYYHILVALDKNTYKVKRYSNYFTFEGQKVEYTLGMVEIKHNNSILIGYSLYDSECKFVEYPVYLMNSMLINRC